MVKRKRRRTVYRFLVVRIKSQELSGIDTTTKDNFVVKALNNLHLTEVFNTFEVT
jgi:hypothetical protein